MYLQQAELATSNSITCEIHAISASLLNDISKVCQFSILRSISRTDNEQELADVLAAAANMEDLHHVDSIRSIRLGTRSKARLCPE